MVKQQKLYERIQNHQQNIRFKDFTTLMEYFGFTLTRVRGSHHLY